MTEQRELHSPHYLSEGSAVIQIKLLAQQLQLYNSMERYSNNSFHQQQGHPMSHKGYAY
ncbi:hypothetical protein [Pectobacterium odoriferum]|uniref:hypothetical protein n=1 Tax=Pectobacterium odoriferum TaxID=78398 RepID=UPI001374BE15|nr:hypothetical protein [Pectobacterium odoriferum]